MARFEAANAAAGKLMMEGHKVFSPISHTHPIAEACGLPLGFDFWEEFDRAYLSHSHCIVILRVPGWAESKGVQAELRIAGEMGLALEFMDPPLIVKGRERSEPTEVITEITEEKQ